MAKFRDLAAREYSVSVSAATLKLVRQELDIGLGNLLADDCRLLIRLHNDMELLVDVLWCICRPQAAQYGLDAQAFAGALGGPTLGQAADALFEALADFSPRPKLAASLRALVQKGNQMTDEALDKVLQELQRVTLDKILPMSNSCATNSPASSESTPDPLP